MIKISTTLSEKDYINVCFVFLWCKSAVKVLMGIYLMVFFFGTTSSILLGQATVTSFFPILIIPLVMCAVTYFSAKRNYME